MAGIPDEHHKKLGDEQIAASKKAQKEFADKQKEQIWSETQEKLSDSHMLHDKVTSLSTEASAPFNPKTGTNTMSVFDGKRDFEDIPEITQGEQLKEQAQARAEKKAESKDEWNKIAAAKKADNSANFLFEGDAPSAKSDQTTSQRAKVDELFDGLISQGRSE